MDIHSISIVVVALVFVGMLYTMRYGPPSLVWLRLGSLDMTVVRDTAQKAGLGLWLLALVRGVLNKDISAMVAIVLFVIGTMLCYFAAYRPPGEK